MKKDKEVGTEALHAQNGDNHIVAVDKLRVLLLKDNGGWFAQGLEIDYAASGSNIDETKTNFETGFCKTVHEHLILHGTIDNLLKVAPQEAWAEFYKCPIDAVKQSYSCFQFHTVEKALFLPEGIAFPFNEISFISREPIEEAMAA